MRRALALNEASYGTDHPLVAICLKNLATLLHNTNRRREAEELMRRHLKIFLLFARSNGYEHPHWQAEVDNYLNLMRKMGIPESEAAERVAERVAALRAEVGLGSE